MRLPDGWKGRQVLDGRGQPLLVRQDENGTVAAVVLHNDCKYGYKIKGSTLDLALLRSPKYPDFEADQGRQAFTYALLPHTGTAIDSDVLAEMTALNRAPPVLPRL